MGNCLNATPDSPFDVSLLLQLRQKSLDELIECIIILKEDYPDLQCLDYSQFQDTFQHLVDDAEPFFLLLQNEKNIDGVVDVYEALAVFAIFSKDKFEKKAQFIFELFDFNTNKSLELPELILTLQSVLRGLCKFVHIPPPPHKLFEEEGQGIFNKIDLDHNERINFQEFITWSDQNIDLQDFLLKYAGIQMYGHLKIGFDKIYKEYTKFFNIAGETAPEGYAKIEMLRKLIDDKEGRLLKKEDIDFLFEVMVNTTIYLSKWNVQKGGIFASKEAYEAVIKAWCSFLASDLNRDNMLVMQELHGMLWLYDGKEPSDERVEYEMNEIRKEGCEGITIMAWMKNLCVVDKAGKYSIRPTLRHLFDKYDVDGSGYLNYDELKQIINETFRRYVEKSPNVEIRKKTEDVISKLTTEVFSGLDQNGSTNIGWEEFKKFMQVSFTKMDVMRIIPHLNFEL